MKISKNWSVKVTWRIKELLSFIFTFIFIIACIILGFIVTILTLHIFGEVFLIPVLGICLIVALISTERS